ncbi:MAG: hypothetical protein AAFN09_11785 [Pseudomonadota bacterium]
MNKHIKAAVRAALGDAHLAHVATMRMDVPEQRPELWVDVIYRGLDAGPDTQLLRDVLDSVAEATCASDPTPVLNFVSESDLMRVAAE